VAVADSLRERPAGFVTRRDRSAPVVYDAFFSYSHAKDKAIATALQALCRIPARLGTVDRLTSEPTLRGSQAVTTLPRTGGARGDLGGRPVLIYRHRMAS